MIQQVELPWEIAQPHGIKVGNVLLGHAGDEVVFRTVHGGLCFYDVGLAPVYEWPEPGIEDFILQGPIVTILSSRRAVLANVFFDNNNNPQLLATSQPLPTGPSDQPCQGVPRDLELMLIGFGSFAAPALVSLWDRDSDGVVVRAHTPDTLDRIASPPAWTHLADGGVDIATCRESGTSPVGDHLLVLTSNNLMLFNQFGNLLGNRTITQSAGGYYPFGRQALSLAVGNLLLVGGGSNGYSEQVVISTQSGHLVWMEVGDLFGGTQAAPLPPSFDVALTSGAGTATQVQPHTNQALSATWAIARHPAGNLLHVCDQNGGYWKVGPTGTVEMWDANGLAANLKGWQPNVPLTGFSAALSATSSVLGQQTVGSVVSWMTQPWCPNRSKWIPFERTSYYHHNNWVVGQSPLATYWDMFLFPQGGSLLPTATGVEAWYWSKNWNIFGAATEPWGNHVEGLRIATTGQVTGIWSSTGVPVSVIGGTVGDKAPYHDMRSMEPGNPAMNHQAAIAVKVDGQTLVVLGCPGGRVRVIEPGGWNMGANAHGLGGFKSTTDDHGFGGAGLAARASPTDTTVRIWYGTLYDPVKRPAAYGNATGTLSDDELAVGAVHRIDYMKGQGYGTSLSVRLEPGPSHPRGAYGVVGLLLTDLLPQHAGDELIVSTLSGDLIVLSADSMQEIWRTHVQGAVGFYNSMVAEDLDNDGKKELYVAGSRSIWRFVRP